ncbi:hypothetical protein FQN57_001353 [Myotisia sp. PD_48]|nr:hypothetical protein FQN57_001353 [Myotisia sp. PD_48]
MMRELDGSSPMEPASQLVPVVFEGVCGRRHPGVNGGDGLKFAFPEYAPRYLCMPGFGHTEETAEATCRFAASMATRHHADLLRLRSWDCQFCGDKATTFNLVVVSFLAPDVGTTSPVRRSVWSYCVPICRTAGSCDQKAGKLVGELRATHLSDTTVAASGSCMGCGGIKNLLPCAGCKMVQYCSRKCRQLNYPTHKKDCRMSQREQVTYELKVNMEKTGKVHAAKETIKGMFI